MATVPVVLCVVLFMAPLVVLYLLVRESELVGRLAWDKSEVGALLRRGLALDAQAELRKRHVRRRLAATVGGAMVLSAAAATLVLRRCASCPCAPLLAHALRYAFVLLGLTALGFSTPGSRGDALGAAALGCGLVASLSSLAAYGSYGLAPMLLFLPNVAVDAALAYGTYQSATGAGAGDARTCDTACGTADIFADLDSR